MEYQLVKRLGKIFLNTPESSGDLTTDMISSNSSFDITKVMVSEPKIYIYFLNSCICCYCCCF